jgi:tetratricopeptide (TPR) repeat protein
MEKASKTDAYLARADALTSVGRWSEAIPFLGKALAIDPQHYGALCALSACHRYTGGHDEAQRSAEKAIAVAPELQRAYYQLALAHIERDDLEKALRAAREAYRIDPQSARGVMVMTLVLSSQEKWAGALKFASDHRRLFPGDVAAYVNLGMVYVGLKRWSEAEECSRLALQIDPCSSAAMNNLAVALRHQEQLGEALNLFERAASLDPQDSTARGNLADISRILMNVGTPDVTPLTKEQQDRRDEILGFFFIGGILAAIVWAISLTETVVGFILALCGILLAVGLPLSLLALTVARYKNYRRLPASSQQLLKMVRRSDRPWLLGKSRPVPGVTTKRDGEARFRP